MLKALIIGADGVCPSYIFQNLDQYPNLSGLINRGAYAAYPAYVQKGYQGSYLSEMNWASIYTGLAPWEHHITVLAGDGCRTPSMERFRNLRPFWQVLNEHSLTVGLWAADCCVNPVPIAGYAVSARYKMIEAPVPVRTSPRTLQACDTSLLELIPGQVPPRLYPRTLAQQGYVFEQLRLDPELAWRVIETYHFQDALQNFEEELEFFFRAMCRIQEHRPVDVLYFYTPTTDLIGHCAMYCDSCDVLVKAYRLLDRYVGKWLEALRPENVIVLSDHGMSNFNELVHCSNENIRREAFAARDEVIWLPNGYIAFEARNGALLFTAHGLKGTFIAAGKDIRHTGITEMRTLDIYPTILELLGAEVPQGRSGYVLDIFNRPVRNRGILLQKSKPYRTAAVLQCVSPSFTDILLNELYIRNRFTQFTVAGDERFREIYLHNPRVSGFVSFQDFDPARFDAVYCGIYTERNGLTGHIRTH
ncbi:MAG: alkaline phosphatase family protein [Oscillospiraceae bacterium]|nr:alkaline phosphatase family protein [Oscillospiraceae bacterium]